MSIRVLIADDHAVVRKGLIQILSEDIGVEVVGEADDGMSAISLAREHEAEIFILDMNMPGPGGLAVLAQLRDEHPDMAVLILSMHSEEQYGVRMLSAGASGYLEKNAAPERLIEAVRKLASGRRFISDTIAEALLNEVENPAQGPPHENLSDREFQVFEALAKGESVSSIAENLSLSVKTVSTYRSRVLAKLAVSSNVELARYAVDHGLID